jgi:dipeptidase, putative
MTIDFKSEVEKRKEVFLQDLIALLKINSERNDEEANGEFPFGPGPSLAMLEFLKIAHKDGFKTANFDNYVGEVHYGQGQETLGIFVHADVVPAGQGWTNPPYEPILREGRLYARGVLDNKGPALAAYYALKILKEVGVSFYKKVNFIIGTDEESGWKDMAYYLPKVQLPDFGFSPDARFPVVNGEKSNLTEYLHFGHENDGDFILHDFRSGIQENCVPEEAQALLTSPFDLEADFEKYLKKNKLEGRFAKTGAKTSLQIKGKSAHSSTPEVGENAATYLAKFLAAYDFGADAQKFLEVAGQKLHQDFEGKSIGIAYEDEDMGKLSVNPSVFHFAEDGQGNKIALNIRHPKGLTEQDIQERLSKHLTAFIQKVSISALINYQPHYLSPKDPLVQVLLSTYHEHTGDDSPPQTVGGGTYGRLMKRGVAYGALFPDSAFTMHQTDEHIKLEELYKAIEIYTDAIYRLVCVKDEKNA